MPIPHTSNLPIAKITAYGRCQVVGDVRPSPRMPTRFQRSVRHMCMPCWGHVVTIASATEARSSVMVAVRSEKRHAAWRKFMSHQSTAKLSLR